jgi:hypothetical protein
MKRLRRLCEATRAISHAAQIILRGIPDRDDLWVIRITVGEVILLETGAGLLDKVILEATKKLQSLSQRMLLAASAAAEEADTGPDSGESMPPPPDTPKIPT